MTNNTLPNVPRKLLEVIEQTWRIHYQGGPVTTDIAADAIEKGLGQLRALLSAQSPANHVEDVRSMVAAPSPAGVDGLEVATFLHTLHMELGQTEQLCSKWKGDPFGVSGVDYSSTYSVTSEPLCRLSDAQAIIDGLRGELKQSDRARMNQFETIGKLQDERDQQAQRIGELAELAAQASVNCKNTAYYLRKYRPDLADICSGWCVAINAALSAGKEGE